jgi:hypothetical protein
MAYIDDSHVFFLSRMCRLSSECFEQVRAMMSVIFATSFFFHIHTFPPINTGRCHRRY